MMLPKPSGEFEWTQEPWGAALRCRALPARHRFTTRQLALTGPPSEQANAWRLVASAVGVAPERLQLLHQVHGATAVEASAGTLQSGDSGCPEADVVISDDPTIGVVVRVADCVPLLIADPRSGAVAAVHAGWRGMAAGAPLAAVAALVRTYRSRARDLIAAVGPSIGPCCYVVGPELPGQFAMHSESASWFAQDDDLRLDLWRAAHDQLHRAGLAEQNIHLSQLCTACRNDLFCSFRIEKEKTGRMVGAIRAEGRRG